MLKTKGLWNLIMQLIIKNNNMSLLSNIESIINKSALIIGSERNFLEEKRTSTKIQLNADGLYLLYDFERIKKPLLPFFEQIGGNLVGLNSVADKVIITEDKNGKLWVFIVELKEGRANPKNQIFATKQLMIFIIESVNRQFKVKYEPEIRGLGYSKRIRPVTKPKSPYDKNNNAFFTGNKLDLKLYKI
jgi:hypothetical protein